MDWWLLEAGGGELEEMDEGDVNLFLNSVL